MPLPPHFWSVFLSTSGPVDWDQQNWRSQTAIRQAGEAIEYQGQQILDGLRKLFDPQTDVDLQNLPAWLEPVILWIARGLAIALVGVLLYWLALRVRSWLRRRFKRFHQGDLDATTTLPTPLSLQEWLEQARQAQLREDYATACRALYMALLLRLAASGWLALDPARTNREYIQGLESLWVLDQRPLHLRDAFVQIFQIHDRLYYGKQPIAADTWQHCQAAYQSLESHLIQQPTAP